MDPALNIARLIGPVLAVVGIGMLTNGIAYHEMAGQFLHLYPLIYLSSILALLAGLTILYAYHRWTRDWRSLITAVGWILAYAGTFRILAPKFITFKGYVAQEAMSPSEKKQP